MVQQQFVTRCNQGSFDRDAGRPSTPRLGITLEARLCVNISRILSSVIVPTRCHPVGGERCSPSARLVADYAPKRYGVLYLRDYLQRLRLFREGIDYHFIFKHHQSFPQYTPEIHSSYA